MGNVYDQSTRQRLMRLQSLTEQIEKPAQSTEVEIWRELLGGQRVRAGVR
jgi:F0F1-type ATP synthase delta subunit